MSTNLLFRISKYPYQEAFLESQMAMAGSNQSKFMEDMKSNRNHVKQMSFFTKIMVSMFLAMMILIPIQTFQTLEIARTYGVPNTWITFTGGALISIFMVVETIYLISISLFTASSFFSGETYLWLRTLPIKKRDMGKISLFAFFRGIDIQIYVIILIFPIATIIATQNILLMCLSLLLSFLQASFSFSLLVILGEKINRVLKINDANTKKSNFIRIFVLSLYFISLTVVMIGIMTLLPQIPAMMFAEDHFIVTDTMNHIIRAIPYPFNSSYIITELFLGYSNSSSLYLITAIIGFILFILVDWFLFKKALKKLELASGEIKLPKKVIDDTKFSDVSVRRTTPVQAFFNKDKKLVTRDMQVITGVLLPIMYGFFGGIAGGMDYMVFSAAFLIYIFLKTESNGGAILASLPYKTRDQAKAKLIWPFILTPISSIMTLGIALLRGEFQDYITTEIMVYRFLILVALGPILSVLILEYKVRMFGKLKYKYVLDEVNKSNSIIKWGILIIGALALHFLIFIGSENIFESYGIQGLALIFIPIEIVLSIISYYIFNRMFPK
ncbi:hypothetical protein DSAG12_03059 [Promethearchaeum syntrophicum]|uniref:Uncharacterized protein n=1 Tax=Promethearchaeum syntrophicum TaxID=2594042 RepID=A0A5B9DEF8_9ARCH|nr:hypothetical protein [Candidatus Prometheoarchaeum syntrophicum]QEE17227.1 hypothetical protein DSAG12_03059 [Candidatus Prometheoarchaeum syntrophicum]